MAGWPDPEECCASVGQLERELEADYIPVERDGAIQVANYEMCLEQAGRRLRGHTPASAIEAPEVSARWANGW